MRWVRSPSASNAVSPALPGRRRDWRYVIGRGFMREINGVRVWDAADPGYYILKQHKHPIYSDGPSDDPPTILSGPHRTQKEAKLAFLFVVPYDPRWR